MCEVFYFNSFGLTRISDERIRTGKPDCTVLDGNTIPACQCDPVKIICYFAFNLGILEPDIRIHRISAEAERFFTVTGNRQASIFHTDFRIAVHGADAYGFGRSNLNRHIEVVAAE